MSHFYGSLQGCRGEATRCGSKQSGIETYAASWDGAIYVRVQHNEETKEDTFFVAQIKWQENGINQELASGVIGKSCINVGLLKKILDHKEVLPALIGLDPELDRLIGERMKQ